MRTLTSTLLAAQKAEGDFIAKIVLTKTAQTTRTYVTTDEANPLVSVSYPEQRDSHTAEVIIDNTDSALSTLDLQGYQGVISTGFNTSAGDEYSAKPPMTVVAQRYDTYNGIAVVVLSLASKVNQMRSDRAAYDYTPASSDTNTPSDIISGIAHGTYSTIGTTDLAGAVKTLAAVGASSVVLKNLGTGTINKGTKFLIAGDAVEYTLMATATIAANEATVAITPTLAVQADVNDVVTLIEIYSHCEDISIGGTLDTDKDPVISAFKPADFFKVRYGESRWAKIQELLNYTFTVIRVENDGDLHYLHYKNGWAALWTAATVIRKGETRRPVTANGHVYTCTTAGTTHATTEPTWPTTEDATVSDNTVVWTLDYDYQYSLTDGDHRFTRKGKRLAIVSPNRITVESDPSHAVIYSATATDLISNGLIDLREKIRLRLTAVAENPNDIAKAVLGHHQIETDVGYFVAPTNVGLELYDLIRLYDEEDSTTLIGNVMAIHNRIDGRNGVAYQVVRLGLYATDLYTRPASLSSADRSEESPPSWTDFLSLLDYVNETTGGIIDALKKITVGGLANVVEDLTPQLGGDLDLNGFNIDFPTTANISDVLDEDTMSSDSATKLATQQSIKAHFDNNRSLIATTKSSANSAIDNPVQNTSGKLLLVVIRVTHAGSGTLVCKSDSAATPTTEVGKSAALDGGDADTITFPVEVNHYYNIITTSLYGGYTLNASKYTMG